MSLIMTWRIAPLLLLALGATVHLNAQDEAEQVVFDRIVDRIETVDRLRQEGPFAVFGKTSGAEGTMLLLPEDEDPTDLQEVFLLYADERGLLLGSISIPQRTDSVFMASIHYFDDDGNTVAVRHEMAWYDNGCSQGEAVEAEYELFDPPGNSFDRWTTLTDPQGNDLDPGACRFPDVERRTASYYHRDMFLMMNGINLD